LKLYGHWAIALQHLARMEMSNRRGWIKKIDIKLGEVGDFDF